MSPGPGRKWVLCWTSVSCQDQPQDSSAPSIDEPSTSGLSMKELSFEESILDKIRPIKPRAKVTRRKIDFTAAVISDEAYLKKIQSVSQPKPKRAKISKLLKAAEAGQQEDKLDLTSSALHSCWKALSPPVLEEDLLNNWCACVYIEKDKEYLFLSFFFLGRINR